MDVLDSPLNSAHLQCRKAESCLEALKFEEAILCHEKAAELLTKAMMTTSVPEALESLKLQRQRHLLEIPVIRHKQKCEDMKKTIVSPTPPPSRSPSGSPLQPDTTGAVVNGGTVEEVDGEVSVLRTMEECDSLLAFLRNRAAGQNIGTPTPSGGVCYTRNSPMSAGIAAGVKRPKSDAMIVEELRLHNEALRGYILELLRENEGYYNELLQLRQENVQLHATVGPSSGGAGSGGTSSGDNAAKHPGQPDNRPTDSTTPPSGVGCLIESTDSEKSEKYYPNPNRIDINDIPSMELPPLEMPKFDFDSLSKLSSSMQDSQ